MKITTKAAFSLFCFFLQHFINIKPGQIFGVNGQL